MDAQHPEMLPAPQLVARWAAESPDDVFLQEVGGETSTAGQLHEDGLRWASVLTRLDIGPGDYVATIVPNSVAAYALWFGLSWRGAVEVALHPEYRGRMLTHTLTTSRATVAVVAARHLPGLIEVLGDVPHLQTILVLGGDELPSLPQVRVLSADDALAGAAPVEQPAGPSLDDVACTIFTSGTTGPSKGVLVPWRTLASGAHLMHEVGRARQDDVWYVPLIVSHIGARGVFSICTLNRNRMVLRDRFSASAWLPDIRRYGVTVTVMAGAMATMLTRTEAKPDDVDNSLQFVFMVPINPDVEEFKARFGVERVETYWGMTELGTAILGYNPAKPESCGRARHGFHIRLVDANDTDVGVDAVGEALVRHDIPTTVTLGYLNMPEQTAAALTADGWFRTGDGLKVDADGYYYYVDRFKDAIRRRGENISSFEIEDHTNEHPDVLESAAVGVPSDLGEEDVKVFVVARPHVTIKPAALHAFLKDRMPAFMVPRYIEVIDELPRTEATLRIQKTELRKRGHGDQVWDASRHADVTPT